jgi:hypothetical protein
MKPPPPSTSSSRARASLEEASAIRLGFPHEFLALPPTRNNIFGHIKLETG